MTPFERVKEISDKRGLSLQKVATDAGLGINAVYRWKKQTPTSTSISKVAKVLNVSTDYLLGNTDEIIPNKKGSTDPEPMDNSIEGIKKRLVSYDGSPVTDHDAKLIKQYLDTLFEGRE